MARNKGLKLRGKRNIEKNPPANQPAPYVETKLDLEGRNLKPVLY